MPPRRRTAAAQTPPARPRARFTADLPADLAERVRDAIFWTRLTVTEFFTEAAGREITRLERAHRQGKPFPTRTRALPPGRRPR